VTHDFEPDDDLTPEEREAKEIERKQVRAEQRLDIRWILDDPRGRRFLQRIIARFDPLQSSLNVENMYDTARREGWREVVRWLLGEIGDIDPKYIPEITAELVGKSLPPNDQDG
jgi:hypothetical protein